MSMSKKLSAEFIGTFWLVLGGCGSAVLAAGFPELGIGFLGVSLAFGLTVLTMAFAIGHISGCHINPAVSVGLWVGGRFPASELLPYVLAQVLGGIAGAAILYVIATGQPGFELGGFASNGYGEHSPGGYSLTAALDRVALGQETLIELIRTQGPGEGIDAESRMRLRSIDVQMLRILEEISAGRQESLAELRKDIELLVKALSAPRAAARMRPGRGGPAAHGGD